MNKLLMLAALSLSTSAFANFCEVDMVDNRTNRVLETFQSNDRDNGCKEGMKQCRLEIRMRNLLNRADCLPDRVRPAPRPTPGPAPRPMPRPAPRPSPSPSPYPTPDYGYEAKRHIQAGEEVIMTASYYTVIGTNFNNLYAVKNRWNQVLNNIKRENLSVTTGCNLGLCVNDSVLSLSTLSDVTIAGLGFHDDFVTKNKWNMIVSNVDRSKLAVTNGCVSSRYAQICVGNQVINQYNSYLTVAAIQMDGRVVLKNKWSQLSINVDPSSLVVTR